MIRRLPFFIAAVLAFGCGSKGPATPSETPGPQTSISIEGIQVTSTKTDSGYRYSVTCTLRETGGLAATIDQIVLAFSANAVSLGSATYDRTSARDLPAGGTRGCGVLSAADNNEDHPSATTVLVTIRYTDANQRQGSASQSGAVPEIKDVPIIEFFSASPSFVSPGDSSRLSWSVSNVDRVYLSHGIGDVEPSGSVTVTPDGSTTYVLSALNGDGESNESARVTVRFPDVEYVVEGTRASSITIAGPTDSTLQFADVRLPWSYTFSGARSGDFLYVAAQNDTDGCIRVEIRKRGSFYRSAQSCGRFVIASVSGTF